MMNSTPVRRATAALAVVTAMVLVLAGQAAAARQARPVELWFLRDGAPAKVVRSTPTVEATVQALLRGPTALERARGFTSAIPDGTAIRDVSIGSRIVTVDLAARFTAGRHEGLLRERVSQLVRTLRGIPGVRAVRVRIEGGVPIGLFPGYDLRRPVSAPVEDVAGLPTTGDLQQLLVDLGFMAPAGVTGTIDAQTTTAVLGFQKWAGLPRDGLLTDEVTSALLRATRPEPVERRPGRRIEVHLERQVALLIEDNRVRRTIHISSGAGGATPSGSFRIYRKERYSWSIPFKVWLPWASYFVGGIAFHEFDPVPTYAASHGCIRVTRHDAEMLYRFADFDVPVDVLYA